MCYQEAGSQNQPLYCQLIRYVNKQKRVQFWQNLKANNKCNNVISNFTLNPFKPEFTIVIFIHYKARIAVAILDLQWMKMIRIFIMLSNTTLNC